MKETIGQLEGIVQDYTPLLLAMGDEAFSQKPNPEKWSKKEILGHLVDSAQNNIRRFVVAQYEELPSIGYNQDKWVSAANYQAYDTADLVTLWSLLNKHICRLLHNMSPGMELRECKSPDTPRSIAWLASDYNKHLLHHLHHLLGMDPVAYP
jgi:hypothetical protein